MQEKYHFLGHKLPESIDPNFDPMAWSDTCQSVYNKNLFLIAHSYDAFILKCSEDFETRLSRLNVSDQSKNWALSLAAGWGYEAPKVRAARQLSPRQSE